MSQADFGLGKQYWQHTGDGVSSRLAEHCLHLLGESPVAPNPTASSATSLQQTSTGQRDNPHVSGPPLRGGFSRNKHYSKKSSAALEAIIASSAPATPSAAEERPEAHASTSASASNEAGPSQAYKEDLSTYIEERYARNLAHSQAPLAKTAMKRRIAGVLKESPSSTSTSPAVAHTADIIEEFTTPPSSESLQKSTRGVTGLTEEDVFLYPTGMSAIFHAFMTVLKAAQLSGMKQVGKSVCFGFPYTDTLKILQKWGPGCHFFGRGLDSDLEELEDLLRRSRERYEKNPESTDPEDKPILSLFCEFPSNPLLRSPNLKRLRELADKYGFAICVDETVGGFVNIECLPYADIVMSSLTKVFSGDSNVMGGS
jgi:cystathionine gamma-synthase